MGRGGFKQPGYRSVRRVVKSGPSVTIHGKRMSVDGKKIVDADRLSVNGEQLWNASSSKKPKRMSSRN